MTPQELLEEVKGRFIVLFHNDEAALLRLLRRALGKFQDRAGVLLTKIYAPGTVTGDIPDLFLSVAACCDHLQRYVPVSIDHEEGKLHFSTTTQGEIQLYYLARLRDWPLDKDLPHGTTSLLSDYLEALIDVVNSERARSVGHAIDGPVQDVPSASELKARVAELELAMEDHRAIIPPTLVIVS